MRSVWPFLKLALQLGQSLCSFVQSPMHLAQKKCSHALHFSGSSTISRHKTHLRSSLKYWGAIFSTGFDFNHFLVNSTPSFQKSGFWVCRPPSTLNPVKIALKRKNTRNPLNQILLTFWWQGITVTTTWKDAPFVELAYNMLNSCNLFIFRQGPQFPLLKRHCLRN